VVRLIVYEDCGAEEVFFPVNVFSWVLRIKICEVSPKLGSLLFFPNENRAGNQELAEAVWCCSGPRPTSVFRLYRNRPPRLDNSPKGRGTFEFRNMSGICGDDQTCCTHVPFARSLRVV